MLRVRGLRAYYAAATAARVGDEMVGVAVVLLVLARTGSPPLAGAVVSAYLLPAVLSGPLLGAWLDRTRFRRTALAANQFALAAVMLSLSVSVGSAPDWTAVALASLVGVTVPMTSGGFTSLLPRFVPAERLGRAHALEGISFNASAILGPAVAATVAATISAGAAVLSIAGFAAISLLALVGVPVRAAGQRKSTPVGLAATIRTGLRHLLRTPPLRGATLATATGSAGMGLLTVALPVYVARLAGDAALSGYVWTAIEAGAVVTALAWGRWHTRWRPERVVLVSLAGFGVALLGWPFAGGLAVLLGLAVLAGLANGPGLPALFTTRQRYTPAELYSQISTTGASLKLGAIAVGAALGGQLVSGLGPTAVVAIAGGIQLLAAAVGRAAGPRRTVGRRGLPGTDTLRDTQRRASPARPR